MGGDDPLGSGDDGRMLQGFEQVVWADPTLRPKGQRQPTTAAPASAGCAITGGEAQQRAPRPNRTGAFF